MIFSIRSSIALVSVFVLAMSASARELVVEQDAAVKRFQPLELLKKAQSVTLAKDPTYGVPKTYRAVDVKTLFSGALPAKSATLLFEAIDGFRVSISAKKLFYTPGARAVLAIEDPAKPWPNIKKKQASAGPFYLIWLGDDSVVGQEEWPFMVTRIVVQKAFAEEYPGLVPKVKLSSKVYRGYEAFAKNCFACHALRDVGGEKMGPDLGIPHSPTEYLQRPFFLKLIRNPQSMRKWSGSQMSAFAKEAISDADVDAIWDYLKHMKK